METLIILVAIIQTFAISLGVGSSTLAIVNFFVAIADGKIDETERKMMGIAYTILRVAMITILITSSIILGYNAQLIGLEAFTLYVIAQFVLIFVLYANALLMTMRVMPSTFGPAIQAGTWYTLGMLSALVPLGLNGFTFVHFILSYVTALTFAVSLVNGIIAYLKHKKKTT